MSQHLRRKPGPGWRRYPETPVCEHVSGLRVHTSWGGLVRLPDGRLVRGRWDDAGQRRALREQGGNRRRGMMVWALEVLAEATR